VQRGIVQAALERHPRVSEFWDDPAAHLGATLARLSGPVTATRAPGASTRMQPRSPPSFDCVPGSTTAGPWR
jgi:hypothetical protein